MTCKVGFVVRNCDSLYGLARRIVGPTLTHAVLRLTFFNHFCAGETTEQIVPKMEDLRRYGIGGILDYAAEAKEDAAPKAAAADCEASTVGAPLSSRTYDYQGEAICDANAEIFLQAIRAVRDASPDGFAAIKLSGLGDPALFERMSICLEEMCRLFKRLSDGTEEVGPRVPYHCIDRSFKLDVDTFSEGWRRLFSAGSDDEVRAAFDKLDADGCGYITYLDWSESVKLSEITRLVQSCVSEGPMKRAALTEEELKLYMNMVGRVIRIMDLAQELGVRVMVDAEWMDIQPAIDHMVLFLQRKVQRRRSARGVQHLPDVSQGHAGQGRPNLERSRREGWRFGAKVVRGAYMVSEREKARKRGVESPICEDYAATEENFHAVIDAILEHSAACGPKAAAEVLVASHNRGSVEHTLRRCAELGIDRGNVYFGQLLGMADNLTFTLGKNGYKAYKYVPYGPIAEVMPYLIRRTQENSAILGSASVQEERAMIARELRRRVLRF
ncbi:unnamed protein product [Prorocentrum cordatum]|uniref:Proline dehydrogenase n=1 Tax=Prorocentrum cordatum TaxID=2364126 RepID=A0ABN9Y1H2_9DINO|nr:unnamed protein product [Polarella glacialis]